MKVGLITSQGGSEHVTSDPGKVKEFMKAGGSLLEEKWTSPSSYTDPASSNGASSLALGKPEYQTLSQRAQALHEELSEDEEVVLQENMEQFGRLFDLQLRHFTEEFDKISRRESDRVIAALGGSPFERIHDAEMRKLWEYMVSLSNLSPEKVLRQLRAGKEASRRSTLSLPCVITFSLSRVNENIRALQY